MPRQSTHMEIDMDHLYKARSPKRQAEIDAAVQETSTADMERARKACDAIVRGHFLDFDDLKENHPQAYRVAMLFVTNAEVA